MKFKYVPLNKARTRTNYLKVKNKFYEVYLKSKRTQAHIKWNNTQDLVRDKHVL